MTAYKKIVLFSLVTIFILLTVGALSYTGLKMSQRFSPLVDAVMKVKYELSLFHLWFEEKIEGDNTIMEEELWHHLEHSQWYARAILDGGVHDGVVIEPIGYTDLEKLVDKLLLETDKLKKNGRLRLSHQQTSKAGSQIDQEFDQLFRNCLGYADQVENALKGHIQGELLMYRLLSILLGVSILLVSIIIGYMYFRNERTTENLHAMLNEANVNLEELVRQRTEELLEAKELAEKANEAKSRFISSMSHELRTPLNAILGFTQLLQLREKDEDKLDSIQEVINAGLHLLKLIDDLLDVSRIESGKYDVDISRYPLNPILQDSLRIIRQMAEQKSIVVIDKVTTVSDHHVQVDKMRFRQVLINLLSNAIKYNNNNGKVVIEQYLDDDRRLCIAISDTGIGISPEHQEKLFHPFERAGAEKYGVDGLGLGLMITRELLRLMGGDIMVESRQQRGSTFSVFVPV